MKTKLRGMTLADYAMGAFVLILPIAFIAGIVLAFTTGNANWLMMSGIALIIVMAG